MEVSQRLHRGRGRRRGIAHGHILAALSKATPRLEFKWAAQKFFGEGYWRNEHNWPWKPGESPPIAKLKDLGHERAQKHFQEMEDARETGRAGT